MVCDILWPYSFTYPNILKIHLCCSRYQYFMPFKSQIIFHCVDIAYFVYLFISFCLFGLFPHVGFYESCESNLDGIKMSIFIFIFLIKLTGEDDFRSVRIREVS